MVERNIFKCKNCGHKIVIDQPAIVANKTKAVYMHIKKRFKRHPVNITLQCLRKNCNCSKPQRDYSKYCKKLR
jgi:hypothetical protein